MSLGLLLTAGLMSAAVSTPAPTAAPASSAIQNNVVSIDVSNPAAPSLRIPGNGEPAPDFTYQAHDQMWQNLHNVLERGGVLLVFGAGDDDLCQIEKERESLSAHGIVPMVVVERPDFDVWNDVHRLNLTFSLLSDPRGSIGEQYGVIDESTSHSHSAWFVIATNGRVAESGIGPLPSSHFVAIASDALQMASDGAHAAAAE